MDIVNLIESQRDEFNELAQAHNAVTFAQECLFAREALQGNSFLMSVAKNNPESLKNAIRNVAAAGITLNPIHARAYLVPRDGRVCLDVSYRGLIFIASDCGAMSWVQAQIVCEKDEFIYKGVGERPIHDTRPFLPRGEVVGFYCVAKTKDGDYLTHTMDRAQVNAIMERSQAYKSFKSGKARSCPWVTDYEEMAKKTVIKQASKTWPKTDQGMRLEQAIQAENSANGIDFTEEQKPLDFKPEDMASAVAERKNAIIEELSAVFKEKVAEAKDMNEKGIFMTRILGIKSWKDLSRMKESELQSALERLKSAAPIKKKIPSVSDVSFTLE